MEVSGKIRVVGVEVAVSDKYRKRELVVTTDEQYPQHISIEFAQDKCDLLNGYNVGDEVKVSLNLKGREWTNPQGEVKFFNSIGGWRIERLSVTDNIEVKTFKRVEPVSIDNFKEDDLPF